MADEAADQAPEIGQQKGAAAPWVVEMAIEEADAWIEEEIRSSINFAFSKEDIAYLAIRMGAVSGLANVPTSDAGQAKAIEMFKVAAGRDAVGAAIAWAVATDIPLPAKALEEAGVSGLPRAVADHQRQSRHDPTRQVLYGNEPAVSYNSELTLDAIDGLRDAFFANAGRNGASLRIDAETQERARDLAYDLSDTAGSWPAGLALDPDTLGQLADTIGRTQGLVGFETAPETREAGMEIVRGFLAADPRGTAVAWAMGTDRPLPRVLFAEHGIDELPRDLGPQHFRDEHARIRQLLAGNEIERDPERYADFEGAVALSLKSFDKGRKDQGPGIVPNEAATAAEFDSWLERNPALLPGVTPEPLTPAEIGELADIVGLTVGLKKIPTTDASRDRGLFAFQRAAARDPQGAVIAWSLGTNLAPPKTLLEDGQAVHIPREVTEFVREGDYRRTTSLLAGTEPTTGHDTEFTRDAISGMRRGFAKTGEAAPAPGIVEAATQTARDYANANAGRWGAEHDPHFSDAEVGELRDIIGTAVGLRKRPTSPDGFEAGRAAFEAALQRDPAGAMVAWVKATDLPMPHDALERRGIDSVPRELAAFQTRSGATARTSALLDGVTPPVDTNPNSYVEIAITAELRRAAEKAGIDDLAPEKLRRQIAEAHRKAVDARKRATDEFLKAAPVRTDDSGAFLIKDAFSGLRTGRRLGEMWQHRRDKKSHEASLEAAIKRGTARLGPATTFPREVAPTIEMARGPVGMAASFSRFASAVSATLSRQSAERTRAIEPQGLGVE